MNRRAQLEEALLITLATVGAAHLGAMLGQWIGRQFSRRMRRRVVVITVPTVILEQPGFEPVEVPGFLQTTEGEA